MHPYFNVKRTGDIKLQSPPKDAIDYVFGDGEAYPLSDEPAIISYVALQKDSSDMLFRTVTNKGQFLFYKMPLHLYKSLVKDGEWAPQVRIKELYVNGIIYSEIDVVRYMFLEHLKLDYGSYRSMGDSFPALREQFAPYDTYKANNI